jgi:hypothetical protein
MQDIDGAAGSKMCSAESGKVVAAGPAPVFPYEIRGLHWNIRGGGARANKKIYLFLLYF